MKQIIIFLLIVILALIGYGKYSQYKRYNAPEVNYEPIKKIDVNYHNKGILFDYYKAVKELDSYVMLQWTANEIDVRTPEDDDIETKTAVSIYADKLAKVNYYEAILNNSLQLKDKGLTNKEIQFIEEKGIDIDTYQKQNSYLRIKNLFNPNVNLYNGEKNAIVYEVQKRLVELGDSIKIDGVYRIETLNAIKTFEEKNHLLADGYLDVLTIDYLFK